MEVMEVGSSMEVTISMEVMEVARNCVSHLRAMPDKEVSQESIRMLTNLMQNIVSNPENEEYRSIQMTDEKFQR